MKKYLTFLFVAFSLSSITAYAGCRYYDYQSINAANMHQIGILDGYIYSDVTIETGAKSDESQVYNLTLVPISDSDWSKAMSGRQVLLEGKQTCSCYVKGTASKFPPGFQITPFQLTDQSLGPILCKGEG